MKVILLFIALVLVSCSRSPKIIDEKNLKSIIYDVAFTDAMVAKLEQDKVFSRDSIRFFEPILKKYGYNIEDFEYTIEKMVLRKSNVLPLLITELSDELELRKVNYKFRAELLEKWDKRADSIYSKRLYLDSMKIKNLDSLKKATIKLNLDRSGELEIMAKYLIDTLDKNRVHILNITLKDTVSGRENKPRSVWLSKSTKMDSRKETVRVKYDAKQYNQAIVNFLEITKYGNNKKDERTKPYVYFDSMMVVYHYPKIESREMLIDSMLYVDKFKRLINNNNENEKKDSSALSVYLK